MSNITIITNPSRTNKPELVSAYVVLSAAYEAERSRSVGLQRELDALRTKFSELKHDTAQVLTHADRMVNLRALGARQQQLTAAGVPCVISNGQIRHQYTRAIIA